LRPHMICWRSSSGSCSVAIVGVSILRMW